ncbi:hypothetical protein PM082_015246 [Marasmius tenuissimus]|nr:hypothetical protein PM082_015246 [Marasmius tenuissimus]
MKGGRWRGRGNGEVHCCWCGLVRSTREQRLTVGLDLEHGSENAVLKNTIVIRRVNIDAVKSYPNINSCHECRFAYPSDAIAYISVRGGPWDHWDHSCCRPSMLPPRGSICGQRSWEIRR